MRRLNVTPLLSLLCLAALVTGADECTPSADPCVVDGVVYEDGESVPDDCNTCTCSDGEVTGCTEIACPPGGACLVDGTAYPDGSVGVPAPDGCNTCECDDGVLSCTEIACPEPDSCEVDGGFVPDGTAIDSADGCNTCWCNKGVISGCTELACPAPDACSVFGQLFDSGWAPSPDGCNSCGCEDGAIGGACSEAACGPIPIVACDTLASYETDAYDLNAIRVDGDTLEVDVAYSGGCAPHFFRLCYDPAFLESFPVQVQLRLDHDGQGDACEAYPSETRAFDLSPLRDAYRAGYGSDPADVILRLGDGATYSF